MSSRMREILESKRVARQRLALLSFSEKLKLLEKLRARSLAIAASPLRRRQQTVSWTEERTRNQEAEARRQPE